MSRVGKRPIPVPDAVQVSIEGNRIKVKGPKGELKYEFHPRLEVKVEDGAIVVRRPNDEKLLRSLHGLTRTLIANMVTGVTEGFQKSLEIVGVGYRANVSGRELELSLGYSHPVIFRIPEGIEITVDRQTRIDVKGIDKQLVGQVAANIRALRPPEPYKGKGIKYVDEVIHRKAGKAGGK